jgi:hypothetical protein
MANAARDRDLVLEEYRTLRDESKQANTNMFTAIQWGSVIVGVTMTATFTQWDDEHGVVIVLLAAVVPALSLMTTFLWLGEAARLTRAGEYLSRLEEEETALGWQRWLREWDLRETGRDLHRMDRLRFFFFIFVVGLSLGAASFYYLTHRSSFPDKWAPAVLVACWSCAALLCVWAWQIAQRLERSR